MVEPAITCNLCPLRGELLEKAQHAMEQRNALADEVASLAAKLKRERAKNATEDEEHPTAGMVREWLTHWAAKCANPGGRGKRPDISPGSDRWRHCRRVMERKIKHGQRLEVEDPAKWALEELKLAVDGILLSPFHTGENADRKRYLNVSNVLKDDEKTDEFIRAAKGAARPEAPPPNPSLGVVGWVPVYRHQVSGEEFLAAPGDGPAELARKNAALWHFVEVYRDVSAGDAELIGELSRRVELGGPVLRLVPGEAA